MNHDKRVCILYLLLIYFALQLFYITSTRWLYFLLWLPFQLFNHAIIWSLSFSNMTSVNYIKETILKWSWIRFTPSFTLPYDPTSCIRAKFLGFNDLTILREHDITWGFVVGLSKIRLIFFMYELQLLESKKEDIFNQWIIKFGQ